MSQKYECYTLDVHADSSVIYSLAGYETKEFRGIPKKVWEMSLKWDSPVMRRGCVYRKEGGGNGSEGEETGRNSEEEVGDQ